MICDGHAGLMACIGGEIKVEKKQQGVDIEVGFVQRTGIPVALAGTVGGRSSQYVHEVLNAGEWDKLHPWG